MQRRTVLLAAGALTAFITSLVVGDCLIVTDEERLEEFVDVVSTKVDYEHLQAALRYVDLTRQPLTAVVRGQEHHFGRGSAETFSGYARQALSPYMGQRLALLSSSIKVEDRSAKVVADTLSRLGRTHAEYELRKIGDDWLVQLVRVE